MAVTIKIPKRPLVRLVKIWAAVSILGAVIIFLFVFDIVAAVREDRDNNAVQVAGEELVSRYIDRCLMELNEKEGPIARQPGTFNPRRASCYLRMLKDDLLPLRHDYPPAAEVARNGAMTTLVFSAMVATTLALLVLALLFWGWLRKAIKVEWK